MKKTILKLILFMMPILCIFIFPLWVLAASGELTSVRGFMAEMAGERPVLVGMVHSDPWFHVKLQSAVDRKPEVLALGSSRAMQFRSHFFRKSFFNSGGGARKVGHFREFLDRIPEGHEPQVLILALDHNYFNTAWDWDWLREEYMYEAPSETTFWLDILARHWHRVYQNYMKGKFTWKDVAEPAEDSVDRIGLRARAEGAGYRNDGSHQWKVLGEDKKHNEVLNHIRDNRSWFVYGDSVSEPRLEEMKAFLEECTERNIHVAGFLPPFSPRVYSVLRDRSADYAYLFRVADYLGPIFEDYGFSFHDFTDPASINTPNAGFVDGAHANEEGYARLLMRMAQADPELERYVNLEQLRAVR